MFEHKFIPPDRFVLEKNLLELYLSMHPAARAERFGDTARAAQVAGVSRRTIQHWISAGAVRAILIGKTYRVDLDSLRDHLKKGDRSW